MPWVKLDDRFHENPKILSLGSDAFRLYVLSLTWAGGNLTDGMIPPPIVDLYADGSTAAELVAAGLFVECDGGWRVNDYLEFNPSREDVEAKRRANTERMKRARDVRAHKSRSARVVQKSARNPEPEPEPEPHTPEYGRDVKSAKNVQNLFAAAKGITPTRLWRKETYPAALEFVRRFPDADYAAIVDTEARTIQGLQYFVEDVPTTPTFTPCDPDGACGGSTWVASDGGSVPCPECRQVWKTS